MATTGSTFWRRATAAVGLTLAATLSLPAVADATPKPDLKAAQKKLRDLTQQVDTLTQQYDKTKDDLTKAQKQLQVYQSQASVAQKDYDTARAAVAQMAARMYENSGGDDNNLIGKVLDAKNPSDLLDQMSIVTAVTRDRSSAVSRLFADAQQLKRAQDDEARTITNIQNNQTTLKAQTVKLQQETKQQVKLVAAAGGPTPNQGTCKVIAASDAAQTAINFACSQLGKPYEWGGTGPYYDCSGLVQAAWGRAGVSLPRTTYDQWNAGSRVGYDQLVPGDLVFFESSLGHVGMYLGGGMMIHDPHTGDVVKVSDISSGYYRSEFQGGVHLG